MLILRTDYCVSFGRFWHNLNPWSINLNGATQGATGATGAPERLVLPVVQEPLEQQVLRCYRATGTYAATSSTNTTIATGSKTFTTQAGLAYLSGLRVRVAKFRT
ncbi:MAG: hypothetical protein U0T74_15450 [Chitinophagales bacterium]